MARGTSLLKLREMFRAEIGAASSVAMGVNTDNQFDHMLRRTQEILWTEHDWEFSQIDRDETLFSGQRFYAFDDDVDFQRIVETSVKFDGKWRPVEYGIGIEQYNARDSEAGEVSSPVERWQHYEQNQFEVWPVPDQAGMTLRFRCYRKLPNLIQPADTALLDDNLIVLRSAAEYLARTGSKDASAKLAQATIHFNRLKGQSSKIDGANFGGQFGGIVLRWIGNRAVRETRF